MLSKLLKRREKAASSAAIPAGQRVYAVGDIHGRDDLLEQLLEKIDRDDTDRGPSATSLIFLGDLVDRGMQSAQVVDRLMMLQRDRPRVRILMGNHEEVFLGAITGDAKSLRMFVRIGGRETTLSYGVTDKDYDMLDYAELAATLASAVPANQVEFMQSFEDMITIGDYLFVHAGIKPSIALDQQSVGDLRWIREPFLSHGMSFGPMVIHGHTITERIDERRNRIGIDTGAYSSGVLSALGLENTDRWSISTE